MAGTPLLLAVMSMSTLPAGPSAVVRRSEQAHWRDWGELTELRAAQRSQRLLPVGEKPWR
ncbi:MAG: hypothetical protein R2749_30470 [Acidimicrobiales bacterium]